MTPMDATQEQFTLHGKITPIVRGLFQRAIITVRAGRERKRLLEVSHQQHSPALARIRVISHLFYTGGMCISTFCRHIFCVKFRAIGIELNLKKEKRKEIIIKLFRKEI